MSFILKTNAKIFNNNNNKNNLRYEITFNSMQN